MQILSHGRYDYSPISERPDYDWPEGKRLAFYIALNVEDFTFGSRLGHTPTELGPPPDPRNHAWRDYGLRVGIWRLFDLADEMQLPMCHVINSAVAQRYPQIVARIVKRGDEMVGHGRTNSERQADYPEAEERQLIREATATLTQAQGQPPRGWMGPWISESAATPDLLKEEGYQYILDWPADDQPFWMNTRAGSLLSVPYPIEINDSPAMLTRRHSAAEFEEMIVDQFEALLEFSSSAPLVFGISLHTFVAGQPFRFLRIRKALEYICNHPKKEKIWFTRPGNIADYASKLPPGLIPGVK